jgi:hypothetical protein
MKKITLALAALLILGTSACSLFEEERKANLPPGKYESTRRSTDAYGTETERSDYTDVEVDEYGNKRVVTEQKTTKDPKGLFNKKTTSKSKKVIEKPESER